jgi:DNA mismatch endonuclease (patch repair protein)
MQANKSRDTAPEVALRSALHRRGLRFRKHAKVLPGVRLTPDVVFTVERVAVFVDGCFWHGCPEHWSVPRRNRDFWASKIERNRTRDRETDVVLVEAGWTVVRVWEHEDLRAAESRVVRVVESRRTER